MKQTTLGYIELNNKYLMLCRDIDKQDGSLNKWIGVGGKLEKGESADECFIREVKEETGISLSLSQIKRRGIVDFKSEKYPDERMYLYTAKISTCENEKCDDFMIAGSGLDILKAAEKAEEFICTEGTLKWIEKDEILKLPMWEGDAVFLNKLINGNSFFVMSLIYGGENGDELCETVDERLILSDVNSLSDEKLFLYTGLNENNLKRVNEPKLGVFIAETPVVIDRAVENGFIAESFLCEHRLLFDAAKYAYLEAPVYSTSKETLCELTGYGLTHGMLAVMKRRKLPALSELLKSDAGYNRGETKDYLANNGEIKRIAVLEDVMNPANVGAIVRSAAALNVDAMILTSGASDPLYRRAIRVSMGNIFDMPYTIVKGSDWIKELKEAGFKIVSMALSDNAVDINDPILDEIKGRDRLDSHYGYGDFKTDENVNKKGSKVAICFGTESTGISRHLLDNSDYVVKIPMSKNVDSLNVAAASAVAFYALCLDK